MLTLETLAKTVEQAWNHLAEFDNLLITTELKRTAGLKRATNLSTIHLDDFDGTKMLAILAWTLKLLYERCEVIHVIFDDIDSDGTREKKFDFDLHDDCIELNKR
jgi:hypothetical protein